MPTGFVAIMDRSPSPSRTSRRHTTKASQGSGFNQEFVWSDLELALIKKYGFITDNLHTDLHECLGHGSGKLLPGTDPDALKAYSSTLEEARADLFGLYYLADPKMVELGLVPDAQAYEAEYYKYMMNGLMTQLVRIELGKDVEEAHMRNRQLIARWVYEQGKAEQVVELKKRDGKTYVVINNYPKLRELFGKLLAEVQRIKSEGDFAVGKQLVEQYGVKVDPVLHAEVRERYEKLHFGSLQGFCESGDERGARCRRRSDRHRVGLHGRIRRTDAPLQPLLFVPSLLQ